jgi:succinyl-CoA synthetase beta subunit
MKLYEHEGKELFKKYGIPTPKGVLVISPDTPLPKAPVVLKAQLLSGDRMKEGGISIAHTDAEAALCLKTLFGKTIQKEKVEKVLAEEFVDAKAEYYLSYSYSSESRGLVLAYSLEGGSGIHEAHLLPFDITGGPDLSHLPEELRDTADKLWKLFIAEHATLAEINPLFVTDGGSAIAGDAKVILDDEKYNPTERRYIDMDGDIAILASGGGASMLNMDALIRAGGKPANYTEYSGNPPMEVVEELTKKVLSKPGLKGCWVVGAAANFTDIYTTLSGLLEGLKQIDPKPTYPIVIRRDGPRREEAFAMLTEAREHYGFDFHLYDSDTPMIETAKIMVRLAYKKV